jgi:AcrR family transcriptional regulator
MPSVPKTSVEDIVAAAKRLIARGGAEALSLAAVAEAVGVRAPSLYKRFPDRAAIVRAVATEAARELATRQLAAAGEGPVDEQLKAVARAQRDYARKKPHLYALVFEPRGESALLRDEADRRQLDALFELLARWMGPAHVLEGARALTAFTHGFASMERAGAFQLGGDVDVAFEFGLGRLVSALEGP